MRFAGEPAPLPQPHRAGPTRSRRNTIAGLALALGLAAPAAAAKPVDRYHARYHPGSTPGEEQVAVRACFDGAAPQRLRRHRDAARFSRPPRFQGRALESAREKTAVPLPELPPDACLDWTVRLGEAADAGGYRTAFRAGEALLTAAELWLWRAEGDREARVGVDLPAGIAFSASWPEAPDAGAGERLFRPVNTPHWWRSRTVFGRFEQRELTVPGGTLELALAGPVTAARADQLTHWLRESALALVPVLGRMPVDRLQTVVVPIGARSEPVPWAHVLRGGGPALEFFVDAGRPLEEFRADWTAAHEFSHLLLPYVAWNDRWLSEGLASYYQNVLRARDGRLGEREAWQKLHEGFERGRRATRPVPLAEAARGGRGAVMRVYWSGAAMMLMADARLRGEGKGNGDGLDGALRALHRCCVNPTESWRARDLMATLDRLTGTDVFTTIHDEQAQAREFPDLSALYAELGLRVTPDGIELDDDAPGAAVRRAIMRGQAPAAAAGASNAAPATAGAP